MKGFKTFLKMKLKSKRAVSLLLVVSILFCMFNFSNFSKSFGSTPTVIKASNLPIGAIVTFGKLNGYDLEWIVCGYGINCDASPSSGAPYLVLNNWLDSNFAGYKGMCFDPVHTGDLKERNEEGSNNWETSTIRKWLNSSLPSSSIDYTHSYYSGNPYPGKNGFLSEFTVKEKSAMLDVTHSNVVGLWSGTQTYDRKDGGSNAHTYKYHVPSAALQNYETAYYQNTTEKVFLMNLRELSNAITNAEPYGFTYSNPNAYYWLRDAYGTKEAIVRYIDEDGWCDAESARIDNSRFRVRPAFQISPSQYLEQTSTNKYKLSSLIDISEATVSNVEDKTYDGTNNLQSGYTLTYNGTILTETSESATTGDYYVTYSADTINAGEVTMTFHGKGNYLGTQTKTYQINRKAIFADLSSVSALTKIYDGNTSTEDRNLTCEGVSGETLHFTVSGTYNSECVGLLNKTVTYTLKSFDSVTGGQGKTSNYDFSLDSSKCSTSNNSITEKEIIEDDLEIDLSDETYSGNTFIKSVSIKEGSSLTSSDFEVTQWPGKDVGEATLIITGKGNSSGTITKHFTINPKTISADLSTVSAVSKTFDGTTNVEDRNLTIAGVTGETLHFTVSGTYESANVGSWNKTVTYTFKSLDSVTGGQAKTSNYTLGIDPSKNSTSNNSITQKEISEEDFEIDLSDETYSGNTFTKSVSFRPERSLTINDYEVTQWAGKDAGEGTIVITGKGNFTGTITKHFTINPKTILADLSGVSAVSKTYDGNTTSSDRNLTIQGVNGETLNFTVRGSYVSACAGLGDKTVIYTLKSFDSVTGGQGKTSNYILEIDSSKNSTNNNTIEQKTITVSGVSASNKTYDGNTNGKVSFTSSSGILPGDDVTITLTGEFSSKDFGTGKTVTIISSLSGEDKDNYVVNPIENKTANISKKKLTYDVIVLNKVFDTTINATANISNIQGIVGSENVSIEVSLAQFSDSSYGTHPVTVTCSLTGTDSTNYEIDQPTGLSGKISKALAKVVFSILSSKTYDGSLDATSNVKVDSVLFGSTAKQASDITFTATYENKNVGTGKKVTITPSFKNLSDANDYDFEQDTYLLNTGEIKAKELTGISVTANNKIYDGTNSATGILDSNSVTGIIDGDNPVISILNGEFSSKNVGSSIPVSFNLIVNNSNYRVVSPVSASANITKKDLHIDAAVDDGDYNTGDLIPVRFSLRTFDFASSDDLGLSTTTGTGTVETGLGRTRNVTISTWPTLTGTDSGNYNELHSNCVVNLTKLDLTNENLEINLVCNSYYDGNPKTVTSTIKIISNKITLVEGTDYTLEYLDDHTSVGNHDVKINFIGSYKGTKSSSFEIKEKPSSGGGGSSGGGITITVGTKKVDEKGKVINVQKAYMNGYSNKTFRPNEKVTREEVATIVARLNSEFTETYNYTSFNDFDDALDRWSKNYIGFCKYKGYIKGYGDKSYKPTTFMTRAELAILVNNFVRIQNLQISEDKLKEASFKDVKGKWYEKEVNKLASLEILNGYTDGTFRGENFVTRAEVTNVMNKINQRSIEGKVPDEMIKKVTSMFTDVSKNSWYFKDVCLAVIDYSESELAK